VNTGPTSQASADGLELNTLVVTNSTEAGIVSEETILCIAVSAPYRQVSSSVKILLG
jgi:hypothetical protein